jgi:hypothetical protein
MQPTVNLFLDSKESFLLAVHEVIAANENMEFQDSQQPRET